MIGILLLYPDIYICICTLLLLIFSVILNEKLLKNKYKFNILKWTGSFSLYILIYSGLILWNSIYYEALLLNLQFICDQLTFFSKVFVLIISSLCLILSIEYCVIEKIKIFEYFILLLLSILGIWSIITSYDLISMYISIELQSLCFYIITSLKVYSNFSVEAGLKYFILGAFSSGLLLFGSSVLYGFTGMTNFLDLSVFFFYKNIIYYDHTLYYGTLLGLLFILSGLFFKIGIVPFHSWLSDIYEGAPTVVSMFFATVPQISLFVLFIRINLVFFLIYKKYLIILILVLSGITILVGTLGAIHQTKLKRLYAFSGISNAGYILSVSYFFGISNYTDLLFYIIIYIISSLNLWLFLIILRNNVNLKKLKNLNDLLYVFKTNKLLFILYSITLFSATGIPPLMGFFIKMYVYMNIIKTYMYVFSIFLVILSTLGAYYYLRFFQIMYSYNSKKEIFLKNLNKIEALSLIFCSILNIFLFFYPNHLHIILENIIISNIFND